MDTYVIWAGLLGALSAVSLLIGSLIGVGVRLSRTVVGLPASGGDKSTQARDIRVAHQRATWLIEGD